jgi:hypothetical protein
VFEVVLGVVVDLDLDLANVGDAGRVDRRLERRCLRCSPWGVEALDRGPVGACTDAPRFGVFPDQHFEMHSAMCAYPTLTFLPQSALVHVFSQLVLPAILHQQIAVHRTPALIIPLSNRKLWSYLLIARVFYRMLTL